MSDSELTFSIVIPTYNRPQELQGCLEAIRDLDYPAERFEVVVVDDGGSIPLEDSVARGGTGLDVTLLRQDNAGPGNARNRGAEHARGRFLAFTDDDCRPDPGWLRGLESTFADHPTALLGGRTVNYLDNPYSETSQVIMEMVYDYYNPESGEARFFASNNMAVDSVGYRQVGGFDAGFVSPASEDRELCDRWLHQGGRMVYVPQALIRHGHDLTLGGFWRQHFNYGRGAYNYHRRRAERNSGRPSDDFSFYSRMPGLLKASLQRRSKGRALSVVCLLLVWQLANVGGYLFEMMRRRTRKSTGGRSAR